MIKLRRYLAYYKKECIIGPLCKLFEAILELLVPLVMAGIIDNGVRNGDTAYIWRMGGLLVILATVGLCILLCSFLSVHCILHFVLSPMVCDHLFFRHLFFLLFRFKFRLHPDIVLHQSFYHIFPQHA